MLITIFSRPQPCFITSWRTDMSTIITFPLPDNVAPVGTRCLQVTIPDDDQYQTLLLAVVNTLSYWMTYDRDPLHQAALVANLFKKVMKTWVDCAGTPIEFPAFEWEADLDICEALRYHNGKLQGFCCGQWQDIGSDDGTAPNGSGGQPGGGQPQPQPGGGCQQYNGAFAAASQFFVPVIVNAGDTLTCNAATGAGADATSGLGWRCVDGLTFFAGACTGGTVLSGGDPAPTIPHGKIVALIAGTYYTFAPGEMITVPGGVVNAPVYVQANFPLSGASGSYTVALTVCNNQAIAWGRRYDFRLSSYGWVPEDTGIWTAGVGFVGQFLDSNDQTVTSPGFNFPSTTLTGIDLLYTKSAGSGANDEVALYPAYPSGAPVMYNSGVHGTDLHLAWSGSQTATGCTVSVDSGTTAGATVQVIQVDLHGTGAIPPGGVPI